jgi:hypothetical protein
MADENQLIRESAEAAQAEVILRSVVFQSAVSLTRDEYTKAWQHSRSDDTAGRELAFHRLRALDDIIGKLEQYVQTGALAKRQLDQFARLNS